MSKVRVLVLRGGVSSEFDVSLRSGAQVLSSLSREKYEPIDVVIAKNGDWLLHGRKREPAEILHAGDIVFNALHGEFGEDGGVQRLCERFGVAYTGSKPYPSLIAMNKAVAKDHLQGSGILLPKHMVVGRSALTDPAAMARSLEQLMDTHSFVVKPLNGGSSLDIRITKSTLDLAQALTDLLQNYEQVLVEQRIVGKEVTCGVIEDFRGEKLYALPTIEIVLPEGENFFSHEAKYNGQTKELCPSSLPQQQKREVERLSRLVHELLELSDYSRSDFIVSPQGIYFLEVNTLPGLTEASLVPKALESVGSSMPEFVDHILTRALRTTRKGV
jgi:D-alanine-D-alanine ligase